MNKKTQQPTRGPWRWEYSSSSKSVELVGGTPLYDKTVMDFKRWGMGGACPVFNKKTNLGYNTLERVCDVEEWIVPHKNREHHLNWCADIDHPDARLIAASPMLYELLVNLIQVSDNDIQVKDQIEHIKETLKELKL